MQTSFEQFKNSINESKTKPALTTKEMRDFLLNYLEDNKYAENEKLLKRDLADFIKVTKAAHKLSKEEVEKLKAYAESKLAKEKADKKKKAVKENAGEYLAQKAYDIFYQFNTLTNLLDEGLINNDFTVREGLSIEDINDHMMDEFDEEDNYFDTMEELMKFLEDCKRVIKGATGITESVRHGVFPYFTVKLDTLTATFSEVSNDLAQEAVLEGNDDPNIITFCTSWSRGQCESVANDVIARLKAGESKQDIVDSLFEEWY